MRSLRSFVQRYERVGGAHSVRKSTYDVHDAHFRLNCLLAMLVRLKSTFQQRMMDCNGLDLQQFERHLKYVVRYAMSELCCHFKVLCECNKI